MTAADLIIVRPLGLTESQLLRFLAMSIYESRLNSGVRLCDLGDVHEWLLELARASELESGILSPARPVPLDRTCPRCGHLHEGDNSKECGFEIAPNRRCRCEMEVPV